MKGYLARNPNLTTEQIDLLYDAGVDKDYLSKYPKLTENSSCDSLTTNSVDKDYLAANRNLTTEQIDLLYPTKGVDKNYLALNSQLTEEQFMRFFNT